jgi:ribosomal protein S18 acetylase RimI-like enzyme
VVDCAIVAVSAERVAELQTFIPEHGANLWNWLPEDGIAQHMRDLADGQADGLLAIDGLGIVGAVTFCITRNFAGYQQPERSQAPQGYICEVVVRRDAVGRGLGAQLLKQAVLRLRAQGLQEVYADRHEENAASAGMMRKVGFLELATFAEPARRPHGSGRTTLCRLSLMPG